MQEKPLAGLAIGKAESASLFQGICFGKLSPECQPTVLGEPQEERPKGSGQSDAFLSLAARMDTHNGLH